LRKNRRYVVQRYEGIVEVKEVWMQGRGASTPDDRRLQPVNDMLQASQGAWVLLDVLAVVQDQVPFTIYILGKTESSRTAAEFARRHMQATR
jgi:hypothetical protein